MILVCVQYLIITMYKKIHVTDTSTSEHSYHTKDFNDHSTQVALQTGEYHLSDTDRRNHIRYREEKSYQINMQ